MLGFTNLKNTGILSGLEIPQIRNKDWRLITKSGILHLEKAFEGSIFTDNTSFIEDFLSCLYEKEFNSILCCGLGLGIAPFICRYFCETIDVIEIDSDLIELIQSVGYLPSNVKIIQHDVSNYTPEKKYDFILLDIWQTDKNGFKEESQILKNRYEPFLNEGGTLCIPLSED